MCPRCGTRLTFAGRWPTPGVYWGVRCAACGFTHDFTAEAHWPDEAVWFDCVRYPPWESPGESRCDDGSWDNFWEDFSYEGEGDR